MTRFESTNNAPTDLSVVGENKDDPSQLLLLGSDGNHYAYSLPEDSIQQVEPDDRWDVDPPPLQE